MIVPAKKERPSTQFAAFDPAFYFFGSIASDRRGITGFFKTKSRSTEHSSLLRGVDESLRIGP
jgi:hypothetical protein